MKIKSYVMGEWKEDGFELPEWPEGLEHEEYLKLAGFSKNGMLEWGEDFDDQHIEFYRGSENDFVYLACVEPVMNSGFSFYIPDYPSFLMFMKEYKHLYGNPKAKFARLTGGSYINLDKIDLFEFDMDHHQEYLYCYIGDERYLVDRWNLATGKDGKRRSNGDARRWLKEQGLRND